MLGRTPGDGADAMAESGGDSGRAAADVTTGTGTESGSPEGPDAGPDVVDVGDGSATSVDAVVPQPTCMLTGQGSSSGGHVTDITWTESCSNGTMYVVTCECPTSFCCCGNAGSCPPPLGSGDSAVPYPDCDAAFGWWTDAGESAAWAACGYPQPN